MFSDFRPAARRALLPSMLILAALVGRRSAAGPDSPPVSLLQVNTGPATVIQGRPGPWGRISYRHVYLEAPELAVAKSKIPEAKTRWYFPGRTEQEVRRLFESAGLPLDLRQALARPENSWVDRGVLRFFPPSSLVAALTGPQRSAIYQVLAESELNEFHFQPAFITTGNADEWLKDSALRPELKTHFAGLCYKRGEVLLFSDLPALLEHAVDDPDRREVMRAFTRTRAVSAHVEVTPGLELRTVASYWSAVGRNEGAVAVLRALESADAPVRLNIVRLLPPLPRRLLFTYPTKDDAVGGRLPDCRWTALNFFNETPDAGLLEPQRAAARLRTEYHKVHPPYELGDVLTFQVGEESVRHACVFVADDIVFTKNGSGLAAPWILMTLEDIAKIHVTGTDVSMTGWRPGPAARGSGEVRQPAPASEAGEGGTGRGTAR